MKIAINSHNYIRVSDIVRADTGAAPGSISSVTASLIQNGEEIDGSSITLSAVTGESDSYEGVFPPLDLSEGTQATVRVVIIADTSRRELDVVALVTRK